MSKGYVLNPTAVRKDDIASPGPDAGPLAGKIVGFPVGRDLAGLGLDRGDLGGRVPQSRRNGEVLARESRPYGCGR